MLLSWCLSLGWLIGYCMLFGLWWQPAAALANQHRPQQNMLAAAVLVLVAADYSYLSLYIITAFAIHALPLLFALPAM